MPGRPPSRFNKRIATEAEANSAFDDITYKKANRFCECWRVFLAKMFSAMEFAGILPRGNILTRPLRICGSRSRKLRRNQSLRSLLVGRSSPDFQS